MALHLRFSARTEDLLEGLADVLRNSSRGWNESPPVVVPSPSVARWIKLRLCERSGPVLGLRTSTLESFLWRSLEPDDDDELLRVPLLQQAILDVLGPDLLERPSWESVRRFLKPAGTLDPRRRVQFAHEMARILLEYEYNRPSVWNGTLVVDGLDRTWPDRPYFHPERESPEETWQRELHGAVFATDGILGTRNGLGRAMGLPRLHRMRRDQGRLPAGGDAILFGLEKVSHFHRNLLLEVAAHHEIHAFLHNPCSSFWEDLDTTRRRGRSGRRTGPDATVAALRRDAEGNEWLQQGLPRRWTPSEGRDPIPLERWGRTARENIALWCQAVEYDFLDLGEDAETPPTLLGDLQESLRQRHPGPLQEPLVRADGSIRDGELVDDGSLRLLEAPDRGREMETVRDTILSWLEENPSRGPGDVVVYLPDPSRHRVEIERVFGAYGPSDPGHLPWALLGASSGESRWSRGVGAILELLEGRFDRPSIFALLRNPLCQARLRLEARDIALWEAWFEGAGILRGWAPEESGSEGATSSPAHSVSGGILRMLLAGLASAEGTRLPGCSETVPPWSDFDSGDGKKLEEFCSALERLHRELEAIRGAVSRATPGEISRLFLSTVDRWLEVADDHAESGVRRALHDDLRHLERRSPTPLDLSELTEIVRGGLEGELPAASRAWTGAVTFAPLKAGNILPHGLVVVPGLDADAFPGERRTGSLDLLVPSRILGDSDPVDDNRHAFLLALLSARDRLVLGWRARDIQKDERKDPSSVILELEEALASGFLRTSPRRRIRLLEREAPVDPKELGEPGWDCLDRPVPRFDPPVERDAPAQEGPRRLELRTVGEFLRDSWNYRIARELDAEEDEAPDTLGADHETLDATPRAHSRLRRELFPTLLSALWSGASLNEVRGIAIRGTANAAWGGEFPEGIQADRERAAVLSWVDALARRVEEWKSRWPRARLETGCDLGLRVPSASTTVPVGIPGRGASIRGRLTAALLLDPSEPLRSPVVLLECRRWTTGKSIPFRQSIEGLLGVHLLARSGRPGSRVVFVSTRDAETVEPDPLAPADGWLEGVVEDLLAGAHEHLPASAVVDKGATSLASLRETLEDSTYRSELERLLEPSLPGEDEADEDGFARLVERRLGPFLSAIPATEDGE